MTRPSAPRLSLDCRDGIHAPACQGCDCTCHGTLSEWRVVGIQIVRCRKLLVLGWCAKLMEDEAALAESERQFAVAFTMLPLQLRMLGRDAEYITTPAERRVEREGILATFEWAKR